MKTSRIMIRCALAVAAFSSLASAALITTISDSLVVGDPTQLGRLTRTGVASDWSTTKAFPGVTNANTTVHYQQYVLNVGITPYIQISIDDPNSAIFVSAYLGSYTPNPVPANRGLDTHYLGDDGSTGNPFTDPGFFQILVALNSNIVVVVNDPSTNDNGLDKAYTLLVEGFIDSQFTDPPVPEPATVSFVGLGLAALVSVARRRALRLSCHLDLR